MTPPDLTLRLHPRWKQSENDTHVFFVGGPFSQWASSTFEQKLEADGSLFTFSTAEQYMMASKAVLFKDYETLEEILLEHNPKNQKMLGRKVKGYDQAIWDANAKRLVLNGNIAKFSQNPAFLEDLVNTGDKYIVEGAWYDSVWGVKLAYDNPLIVDPANWEGTNWLGQVLMTTRTLLRFIPNPSFMQ